MHTLKRQLLGATLLGLLGVVGPANAGLMDTFYLDSLTITKCVGSPTCSDTVIYQNDFSGSFSGAATPSTVPYSNTAASTWGATLGSTFSESRGRLALGGNQVAGTIATISGKPVLTNQAQLQTPRSTDTNALGKGRDLSVVSVWDLAAPSVDRTRYGMRLNDQNSTQPVGPWNNDILDISVVNRGGTSYIEVRDLLADSASTVADSILNAVVLDLLAGDQIALQLAWDTDTSTATALYAYGNGGSLGAWNTLGTYSGVLFSDESYTRARVYVSGQPVPAPQVWLLLGIGLAALRLNRAGRGA